jgi:hypothetical protein
MNGQTELETPSEASFDVETAVARGLDERQLLKNGGGEHLPVRLEVPESYPELQAEPGSGMLSVAPRPPLFLLALLEFRSPEGNPRVARREKYRCFRSTEARPTLLL